MPFGRYSHCSCIMKKSMDTKSSSANLCELVVLGGKTSQDSFSNSVMCYPLGTLFSMTEFQSFEMMPKGKTVPEWQEITGMTEGRACFSIHVAANKIYAFGGFTRQSGTVLAQSIEVMDYIGRCWQTIQVSGLPPLACMSLSQDEDSSDIFILGGSDSKALHSSVYRVDVYKGSCSKMANADSRSLLR